MTARAFDFWTRWLMVTSLATTALGILMVFFDTRVLPGFSTRLSLSLWGLPTLPDDVTRYHEFAHAVLGAVLAAFGIVLTFVVRHAFAARQRWAWHCIALAVSVWFLLDSGMSALMNVWPNVVLNLVSVAPFAVALAATRRAFVTTR